jgi:predicted anti-sigma-YlaC factor YlaD
MRLVGQLSSACQIARERSSLRLDGELSEFEELALVEHLTRCAGCRAHEASLGAISDRLRSGPLEEPEFPVVLPHRLRVRVPLRTAQAAAAAVALAFIGFSSGGFSSGAQQSVSVGQAVAAPESNPAPIREVRATVRFRIGHGTTPRPIRGRAAIV